MNNLTNPFTAPKYQWSNDPVATDVTTLLAASSFLQPFSGLRDPQADHLFERVATYYCSGRKLVLPLPEQTPGHGALLVDLWAQDPAVKTLPASEMTDSQFDEVAKLLAPELAVYLEGTTSAAQWVAFQFTPENVSTHMSRADNWAILRAGPLAQQLVSQGRLNSFLAALGNAAVKEPDVYIEDFGSKKETPSFNHFCVAYVISVALRRLSYARQIGEQAENPIYHYHWIGHPVMGCDFLPGTVKTEEALSDSPPVPWGRILRLYLKAEGQTDPFKVRDWLSALRKDAVKFHNEFARLPGVQPLLRSKMTQREDLVVTTLRQVGVLPRFASTVRAQRLAKILRGLASHKPSLRPIVELVTATLQPEWARSLEAAFRLHFRRDNFWEIFDRGGIEGLEDFPPAPQPPTPLRPRQGT